MSGYLDYVPRSVDLKLWTSNIAILAAFSASGMHNYMNSLAHSQKYHSAHGVMDYWGNGMSREISVDTLRFKNDLISFFVT